MERLILQRQESTDQGTFGRLAIRHVTFFTGELPWRNNKPFLSCIPLGLYTCEWLYSKRFARHVYFVLDVPGREGIAIHPANLMGDRNMGFRSQVDGCIALGMKVGDIRGQSAVLESKQAILEFEKYMSKKSFELEIISRPCTL